MAPTIPAGATVTARHIEPGTYQGHRGDIVVFRPPASWPAHSQVSIKRLIAVGGDTVACCDASGRVLLNGIGLDELYLGENAPLDGPRGCGGRRFDAVTVPAGELFVMGDTRMGSVDSACHGPIPAAAVLGIVQP